MDSSIGPPTEIRSFFDCFCIFRSMGKLVTNGTKWGQEDIPTTPHMWGDMDFVILVLCSVWIPHFWISNFSDFQISSSQISTRAAGGATAGPLPCIAPKDHLRHKEPLLRHARYTVRHASELEQHTCMRARILDHGK